MSMNPGATYVPDVSIVRSHFARPRGPTRTIFPLRIPMSAMRQGEPVPSSTRPPRMTTSNAISWRTPAVPLTSFTETIPANSRGVESQPCLRLTFAAQPFSSRWPRLSLLHPRTLHLLRETVYSMRAFERRLIDIMQSSEEELQAFRRRTKKSAQAWEAAKKRIPFGVNSNYRLVDPYPLYVRKAKGSRIWDADGAEYIDFCMAFGALVAGHSHPVLAKAMRERVSNGTIFGFESVDAGPLADHICRRFRLDRLKFSMTGLDAVPMNMGYVHPKPGFLDGLRRIATEIGALLIFDEVKTCGKWYGGAEEAFGVTPDVKVLGKSIAGGFPLAAVGGTTSIMDQIVPGQIGHAGTFNANPLSISAGLVTMTKILTRAGIRHAQQIGDDLAKGDRDIIRDHGLSMVVQSD